MHVNVCWVLTGNLIQKVSRQRSTLTSFKGLHAGLQALKGYMVQLEYHLKMLTDNTSDPTQITSKKYNNHPYI